LKRPDRGWLGVVVGEGSRCWFGNQFSLIAPKFAAYGVDLWVPELGGKYDHRNPSHKMLMSQLGAMSELHRNRPRKRYGRLVVNVRRSSLPRPRIPPAARDRRMSRAWVKVSTETISGCAGRRERTTRSGLDRRNRTTCPAATSSGSSSVSCLVHRPKIAYPVYRGFSKIARTVLPCQPSASRCRFCSGRFADGHGMPSTLRLCAIARSPVPSRYSAKIRRTTSAVSSSIASTRSR
jgi:hypothetical protein